MRRNTQDAHVSDCVRSIIFSIFPHLYSNISSSSLKDVISSTHDKSTRRSDSRSPGTGRRWSELIEGLTSASRRQHQDLIEEWCQFTFQFPYQNRSTAWVLSVGVDGWHTDQGMMLTQFQCWGTRAGSVLKFLEELTHFVLVVNQLFPGQFLCQFDPWFQSLLFTSQWYGFWFHSHLCLRMYVLRLESKLIQRDAVVVA